MNSLDIWWQINPRGKTIILLSTPHVLDVSALLTHEQILDTQHSRNNLAQQAILIMYPIGFLDKNAENRIKYQLQDGLPDKDYM